MDETTKKVEGKDVTFFKESNVKPVSRPNYIEFELEDEKAILSDPQRKDKDEQRVLNLITRWVTMKDK